MITVNTSQRVKVNWFWTHGYLIGMTCYVTVQIDIGQSKEAMYLVDGPCSFVMAKLLST